MKDRFSRPKPRIHPQMNTDTRRHAEKSTYTRKSKYREDPTDEVEPPLASDPEDEGVLSDYKDIPEEAEHVVPTPPAKKRRGRR